jgi:hypothetical protein
MCVCIYACTSVSGHACVYCTWHIVCMCAVCSHCHDVVMVLPTAQVCFPASRFEQWTRALAGAVGTLFSAESYFVRAGCSVGFYGVRGVAEGAAKLYVQLWEHVHRCVALTEHTQPQLYPRPLPLRCVRCHRPIYRRHISIFNSGKLAVCSETISVWSSVSCPLADLERRTPSRQRAY